MPGLSNGRLASVIRNAASASDGVTSSWLRPWRRASTAFRLAGLAFLLALVLSGAVPSTAQAGSVPQGGCVLLAQTCPPTMQPVIDFLSDVMLVVGGIVIFAGAVRIYRGEIFEGTTAILAGFLIAIAFQVIRWFFVK